MPTDPNDKMRTPGAAARRDMDGRAYKPKKGGCLRRLLGGAAVFAGSITGVVEIYRVVKP